MTDAHGACISVTQSWCEFTGRSQEQSVGIGWFRNIHPLDQQRVQTELDRVHQTHQTLSLEYRLRKADGHYSWVQHEGVPQFNTTQQFTGYINIAIDIVGIQRLEQNLLDIQNEVSRQRDLTNALLDVMAVANSKSNPFASLDFIMDQALRIIHGQIGVIYRYHPESRCLQVLAALGLPKQIGAHLVVAMGQGTAGRAAQQSRPITLDNLEGEALELILAKYPDLWESVINLTQSIARSVAAPIQTSDRLLGALAIYRRDSQSFTEDEISLLAALSAQAALIIHSNFHYFVHQTCSSAVSTVEDEIRPLELKSDRSIDFLAR